MAREKKLTEEIDEFRDKLEKIEKAMGEKKFKKPKLGKAKVKKGYVIVQVIKENGDSHFRKLLSVNGNIHLSNKEEDTYHLSGAEYIGRMNGKDPLIVLPSWSNEPITKEVLCRKIEENKSTIKPQKQIIHLMEDAAAAEQTKEKKSMKGIVMIGIVLIAVYIIGRGQGWF